MLPATMLATSTCSWPPVAHEGRWPTTSTSSGPCCCCCQPALAGLVCARERLLLSWGKLDGSKLLSTKEVEQPTISRGVQALLSQATEVASPTTRLLIKGKATCCCSSVGGMWLIAVAHATCTRCGPTRVA